MKSNHHFMGWKWLKRPFGRKRCASLNIGRTWFFCSVLSIQRWKWDKHEWNWSEHETALKTQWSWLWTVLKSHQIWRWHGVVPANKKKPAKISSLNKTQVNHVKWSSWEKKKNRHHFGLRGFPQTTPRTNLQFCRRRLASQLQGYCWPTQQTSAHVRLKLHIAMLCKGDLTKVPPSDDLIFLRNVESQDKKAGKKVKILGQKTVVPFKEGPFLFDLQVMFNCRCVAHDFCWGQWLLVNKKHFSFHLAILNVSVENAPKFGLMLSGGLKF